MILKKPSSRIFLTNLFADFILSKISHDESTIIKVIDCINFYVIKGKTTSKEVLDIPTILGEFTSKFSEQLNGIKLSHTIDLIEYDCKLSKIKNLEFILHRSDNCSYHKTQIEKFLSSESSFDFSCYPSEVSDEQLIVTSEFPHGYSLNQGRLIYFYGKHIFYNIPTNYSKNNYFELSQLFTNTTTESVYQIKMPCFSRFKKELESLKNKNKQPQSKVRPQSNRSKLSFSYFSQ